MYEYSANGSLDSYLKDEGMSARFSATTRLWIMYRVARAVHFLHAVRCYVEGRSWKVFHGDINSANICLSEDYIPLLIDCGLAKLVEDEHNALALEPTKQSGSTEGPAIGTIGYMCPEYTTKKANQNECHYMPTHDMYSIGIVMAELILGQLKGDPTHVFETYVLNGKLPIVDVWKQLAHDADDKVTWNAGALELVCKIAIGCITPSSEGRLSAGVLLPLLFRAITINDGNIDDVQAEDIDDVIAKFIAITSGRGYSSIARNAGKSYVVHDEDIDDILTELSAMIPGNSNSANNVNVGRTHVVQGEYMDNLIVMVRAIKSGIGSSDPNSAGHGRSCSVCNESAPVVKCRGESHPLCAVCIDDAVVHAPASATVDFRLPCPTDGCSSQPFTFKDLYKHIDGDVWIFHLTKQDEQGFNEVMELQMNVK